MYHYGYTCSGLRYFLVGDSLSRQKRPQADKDRASIVTPAPLLPRKKPLLFEAAFKAGQDRIRSIETEGMELDQ